MRPATNSRPISILLCLLATAACSGPAPSRGPDGSSWRATRPLMGTTFFIEVVTPDARRAQEGLEAAFAEVARVERRLSEWMEDSEISRLNRNAGGPPIVVGSDLEAVVRRAREISALTQGAFDITFAACGRLWSISKQRVPSDEALAECLQRVGDSKLQLDPEARSLRLPEPGMRIGIAGIGKGYGVDRAAEVLEARGIEDYIVEGGGDLRVRRRRGRPWRVGIAHPRRPGRLIAFFEIREGAVATSGDYQNFFVRDGVRYHHILDPRTGQPARKASAVTVVAPTAMDADALATGLFVLGPQDGLAVAKGLDGVEVLFITPELEILTSEGFPQLLNPEDPAAP